MAKIINLTMEDVAIADNNNQVLHVPYESLNFKPEIGDYVEIYQDGDNYIVNKTDKPDPNTVTGQATPIPPNQNINVNVTQPVYGGVMINKVVYLLVTFFLGGLGIHKFLTNQTTKGVLYILFIWTFIPSILALCTFIATLFRPADQNGNILVYK